jgi:hypothetical protein
MTARAARRGRLFLPADIVLPLPEPIRLRGVKRGQILPGGASIVRHAHNSCPTDTCVSKVTFYGTRHARTIKRSSAPDNSRSGPPNFRNIFKENIKALFFAQMTEVYARRAREFSEAVALLGGHRQVGPEVVTLMQETRRRRSLCLDAAERFERCVQESKPMAFSASHLRPIR